MAKIDITTIQVLKDTREKLKELGSKGETYDEIIQRLIKKIKGSHKERSLGVVKKIYVHEFSLD